MNSGDPKRKRKRGRNGKGSKPELDTDAAKRRNPEGLARLWRWLAALATLALTGCASGPWPTPAASATAVALVDANGERYCGAVAVGALTLLTAGHCVTGPRKRDRIAYVTPERWYTTSSGVYWAHTRRVDMERDLAWLTAGGPPMAYAPVRAPREDEALHVVAPIADWADVGGRLGLPIPQRFDGETFHYAELGVEYWTAVLTIAPGWSGSPVYGEDGAIIGVLSACVRTAPGVCRSDYAILSPAKTHELTGRSVYATVTR